MSIRLTLLGTGSSGNCTLVSSGEKHVLVDIGLSGRETTRRLREVGLSPEMISAVVVSHEHGDHCRGVAPFVKDLQIPIFMSQEAFTASSMRLDPRVVQPISGGRPFEVHDMEFTPFAVPHDSVDPLAFTIEKNGSKVGIVLDLGYISSLVVERLRGCDSIVIESNHDVNLLKIGPYPWNLKQRVMSRMGHLSNDCVAEFLENGFDGKARDLILAHLSKQNNLPELALLSAERALERRPSSIAVRQTRLALSRADVIGPTFEY